MKDFKLISVSSFADFTVEKQITLVKEQWIWHIIVVRIITSKS
jgi:hypothetical protein